MGKSKGRDDAADEHNSLSSDKSPVADLQRQDKKIVNAGKQLIVALVRLPPRSYYPSPLFVTPHFTLGADILAVNDICAELSCKIWDTGEDQCSQARH